MGIGSEYKSGYGLECIILSLAFFRELSKQNTGDLPIGRVRCKPANCNSYKLHIRLLTTVLRAL